MFLGLRTVIYPTTDIEGSKAWFTEILGFGPYFDEPFYAGFEVGGYELGLLPQGADPTEPGAGSAAAGPFEPIAYWAVTDARAAVDQLVATGATVRDPIADVGKGIRTAAVRAPDGSLVGIIENPHFALPG
ncbi:MAG: VOC family protein [Acidimicrobiales bacterium]|nr:VOC family protein [Acidimicrobiales bacterium]